MNPGPKLHTYFQVPEDECYLTCPADMAAAAHQMESLVDLALKVTAIKVTTRCLCGL